MTPEAYVKARIVEFARIEGYRNGLDGMVAIACILRNRVKAGWLGGDWLKVIDHAVDSTAHLPLNPPPPCDLADPQFRRLLGTVEDIYHGSFKDDPTGGADSDKHGTFKGGLYYVDLQHPDGEEVTEWFKAKIVDDKVNHPRIAQVGMLYIFQ